MPIRRHGLILILFAIFIATIDLSGQRAGGPLFQEPQTFPLWSGPAPNALGDADTDVPTITVYMPQNTAGPMTAVIIAPGGGYVSLAMNHEGRLPAS